MPRGDRCCNDEGLWTAAHATGFSILHLQFCTFCIGFRPSWLFGGARKALPGRGTWESGPCIKTIFTGLRCHRSPAEFFRAYATDALTPDWRRTGRWRRTATQGDGGEGASKLQIWAPEHDMTWCRPHPCPTSPWQAIGLARSSWAAWRQTAEISPTDQIHRSSPLGQGAVLAGKLAAEVICDRARGIKAHLRSKPKASSPLSLHYSRIFPFKGTCPQEFWCCHARSKVRAQANHSFEEQDCRAGKTQA